MAHKTCALCGYEVKPQKRNPLAPVVVADSAGRCPKCGGASWRELLSYEETLQRSGISPPPPTEPDPWGLKTS